MDSSTKPTVSRDIGPAASALPEAVPDPDHTPVPTSVEGVGICRPSGGTASSTALILPSIDDEAVYQTRLADARLGLAASLFVALRAKHAPTASHCLRVALRSSSWGLQLGLCPRERDELEVAALLHDIGKIGIPDRVLLKPGRLNREEAAAVDFRRTVGQQILSRSCASRDILSIVGYAPAWWDGSRAGFDRRGKDLPAGARMVSIVDAYDAMTNDQVYRPALSHERAVGELFACAGTQFDPELVEQFCDLLASNQESLMAEVSRHWLHVLTAEQSAGIWTWNDTAAGDMTMSPSELFFHQQLLESMCDGVIFVDRDMQVVLWNRAVERLTGLVASSVLHQPWSPGLIKLRDERGRLIRDEMCPIRQTLHSKVQTFKRVILLGREREELSIDMHVAPVMGSDGTLQGATLLLRDASRQITMEQRIEKLHEKATHDPLTSLANRAEFDRQHAKFVNTHAVSGLPYALLICDIDHFKSVNDVYGHQAGDEVLVSFASLLRRSAHAEDLIARYGGEEFIMLCPDCDSVNITRRAERIRLDLEKSPQRCLDNRMITGSFGVTELQAGDTPETMLRRADRALLQAKESGRNRVVQLGTGIPGSPARERRPLLRRWIQPTQSHQLLEETLVTAVPLAITMEKLRGFISDHHAEIVSTEDGKLRLQITKEARKGRRSSDRPAIFVLSLQFLEKQPDKEDRGLDANRTLIRVSIQLAGARDRRLGNAYERARLLFASLKAYFMAQTFEGPFDLDGAADNLTFFRRLVALLHPRQP